MSEYQYEIAAGMDEKVTVDFCVKVQQTSPEAKPGFFHAHLSYGDMSPDTVQMLQQVWREFERDVRDKTGQEPDRVVGDYDTLMVVQELTSKLTDTLTAMGYEYAKLKNLDVTKAQKLRRDR
jgi:hypothetical protein